MSKPVYLPWMSEPVQVEPQSQALILVDGWGTNCCAILQDCEIRDFARFRIPSMRYGHLAYAANIRITGRTAQRRPWQDSTLFVRIEITFVGDGEPDTVTGGWMSV